MAEPREFEYVLQRRSHGGFLIYVPELPGLTTEGATREEATAKLGDALAGYLESMRTHGQPFPQVERGTVAAA
jgi:predicted RNase H-like HicB family nuclease